MQVTGALAQGPQTQRAPAALHPVCRYALHSPARCRGCLRCRSGGPWCKEAHSRVAKGTAPSLQVEFAGLGALLRVCPALRLLVLPAAQLLAPQLLLLQGGGAPLLCRMCRARGKVWGA